MYHGGLFVVICNLSAKTYSETHCIVLCALQTSEDLNWVFLFCQSS